MNHTPQQGQPGELMRIVADVGAVTSGEGLIPGSGALRIELRPLQLVQLARFLPARAIEALGLALEHGVLRLDPFRIEVTGWSRDWLHHHGMGPAAARAAIKELTEAGITVTTLGPKGPRGERVGIIGAAHCGWDVGDVVPIRDGRRPGTPNRFRTAPTQAGSSQAKNLPGKKLTTQPGTNTQVRTVGQNLTNPDEPVDNPVGRVLTNRAEPDHGRTPETRSNMQVNKVGQSPARPETTPPTSSSGSDQKELSARGVLTSSSLTLADVHTLLSSPDLHAATVTAGDGLLVHLTDVFSRADRDKVAAVVEFHGYATTDAPHMVFAALVTQVIQTDPDGRASLVEDLFGRCRAGHANLPRPPANTFLSGWLLTMTAAMSATPTKWGAWVYSGIRRPDWNTSPVMRDVIACLAHLNEHGSLTGAPTPLTGTDPGAGGAGQSGDDHRSEVTGTGVRVVTVDPVTGHWPEQVVSELRDAVAGGPFADEHMFADLLRNPARVNHVLSRWRARPHPTPGHTTSVVGVGPAARATIDDPDQDPNGLSDEERAAAHVELLAAVVEGTRWAEQDEWDALLADPGKQARILYRHRVNQIRAEQGVPILPLDGIA